MLVKGHRYSRETWEKKIIPMYLAKKSLRDILTRFPMASSSFYRMLQRLGIERIDEKASEANKRKS